MKNERGFTLIELLVVIAILAVLFGVTALALSGLSTGETESKDAEKDVVQTALDICELKTTCTLPTAPASGAAPVQITTANLEYLRRDTKYYYCWDDTTGQVAPDVYDATEATTNTCP